MGLILGALAPNNYCISFVFCCFDEDPTAAPRTTTDIVS